MALTIISKPTSRELRERLAESQQGDSRLRGRTRTTEEAHDIERRLSHEGEDFKRPFAVDPNAPESRQARIELAQRVGSKDPERDEKYM